MRTISMRVRLAWYLAFAGFWVVWAVVCGYRADWEMVPIFLLIAALNVHIAVLMSEVDHLRRMTAAIRAWRGQPADTP